MGVALKFVLYLTLALFLASCTTVSSPPSAQNDSVKKTTPSTKTITNKIDYFSKKANVIAVRKFVDGVPTTIELIKLTDNTVIIGFKSPSEYLKNEVIYFETEFVDGESIATKFSRKITPIPTGIHVLDVQNLATLLQSGQKQMLIDARPNNSYLHDHLPGAVSIPLPTLKKQIAKLLPKDKDFPLIFYCWGYS